MTDYLQSDIDLHAIAILTDGFDWELWVRPRNQSLADLANPYAEASLKNPLMIVQRRNMEVDPYRSYEVRKMIDVDGLSAFCLDAIRDIIEHEFRLDPDQIFS